MLASVVVPAAAIAQDDPPPPDLLEYLGSWQDDDEEWFVDAELNPAPEPESGEKRKRVDDDEHE
jgi:hypothetical protein